tara:strand:+ start:1939 stop:2205 length:267 start_codon:yes stop_codon:yes gene_type:complete
MNFLISPSEFDKFDSEKNNKISNFFGFKNGNYERPNYSKKSENDEDFIIKELLFSPLSKRDLEPVYSKNIRNKNTKCFNDKICSSYFK